MNNVLRLAIVDPNDSTRDALKSMLLSMEIVWLEAECSRYEFFPDVVAQTTPDIGVVVLDSDTEKALNLIPRIREASPDCCIVAVSQSTDGTLILRAMRAGVSEFLSLPVKMEDLAASLERIGNQRYQGAEGKGRSTTVIAVAGATGGTGCTSLAVNMGCALASSEEHSVVLVDLDLSLGDADVFLDAIPDYTIVDVAQNVSRLDFTLLKRSLTKHSSGLYLLPRPVLLQDSAMISPDNFHRVIGLLRATFSHVIIDLSKSFSPLDIVALDLADHLLLVTQLDLPCLRNVVRLMMSFDEIAGLKEKTKVVVNRIGIDGGQISLAKAQETIGCDVFWQLPNDQKTMLTVRNNGVPLIEEAPKAAITQGIVQMTDELCGIDSTGRSEKTGAGKWLSFLSSSKTS